MTIFVVTHLHDYVLFPLELHLAVRVIASHSTTPDVGWAVASCMTMENQVGLDRLLDFRQCGMQKIQFAGR